MNFTNFSFLLIALSFLSGCDYLDTKKEIIDQAHLQDLHTQNNRDFEEPSPRVLRPSRRALSRNHFIQEPPIPKHFYQRVSLSIGEHLPLKDALVSLSQRTRISLQLDPSINASLIFSAHNQPFIEVIKSICELANLRYIIQHNSLRIMPDTPYAENYKIQFLNLNRTTENNTSISTNIFANTSDGKQLDNGSNSNVKGKSDTDFWAELENNLSIILEDNSSPLLPTEPGKNSPSSKSHSQFTIHRQGGILTVRATSRQHRLIKEYLAHLRQTIGTQILIEAKIIEVNLKDEFKAGINWQEISGAAFRASMPLGKIAQSSRIADPLQHRQDILTIGTHFDHFTALLQAIEQYGACKTLSSPRLTVLNNQNAILKVAQNQVYFRLRYDRENNTNINRENVMVTSDIQTVPIGLVMSVQPSINPDTNEILLSLRPTISRLTRSVADPAVEIFYALGNRGGDGDHIKPSMVPVVEVREMDSILKVKSGSVAVLGGLMEGRNSQEDSQLPVLGDIPFLGKLVSATSQSEEVVELVILLKATIIDDEDFQPHITESDQKLLRSF